MKIDRKGFYVRFQNGMSIEEISEETGYAESAIRSRIKSYCYTHKLSIPDGLKVTMPVAFNIVSMSLISKLHKQGNTISQLAQQFRTTNQFITSSIRKFEFSKKQEVL
jgi:lambda repressor-like predicted transcriptional regulator